MHEQDTFHGANDTVDNIKTVPKVRKSAPPVEVQSAPAPTDQGDDSQSSHTVNSKGELVPPYDPSQAEESAWNDSEEEKKKFEEAEIEKLAAELKKTFIKGDSDEPNSHGVPLPRVGTGIAVINKKIDPLIAAAAVNQYQAVIVIEGASFLAPMEAIDPLSVELACNDRGCALIPEDGNPDNNITPEQAQALLKTLMKKNLEARNSQ